MCSTSALDSILVVNFTQFIFGPAATQVSAYHGAEVIRIERPGQGDLARAFGMWHNGQSMPFTSLNLSKESLVVDLKKRAGLAVVQ